ncbi:hypothetical protein BGE01nite_17520 [Brevifollis gellanilyticus]|uniref:Beta-lactamase class A catalytic domain-containing protein n=2 Tax=Brevifollis gellanilyticus TaxID=748831 RepID=A0A512M7Y9_9BACT|nr:hypothetical protein BGE01nite_17520 [Brevifollis gellanilyticus]
MIQRCISILTRVRHLGAGRVFLFLLLTTMLHADPELDALLNAVAPRIPKWATVCIVSEKEGKPEFQWHDYQETGTRTDFWPASTIKLYTAIAALERIKEHGFTLDTTIQFEHQDKDGTWHLDCARTMREMLSEVFRRSSNEDYTLLLRVCGVDWLNSSFLTPGRGFQKSALMRGYVKERPWVYMREEPQRLRLSSADGTRTHTLDHHWLGHSWSQERGCTVIDVKTGNMTTPRDLAECLRRLMFHAQIPESERFKLSQEEVDFLVHGGLGFTGLETQHADSAPNAWKSALETLFPKARFYHKCGIINDYSLEVACLDDRANGGPCFILVPIMQAGSATKPVSGGALTGQMSLAIGQWVKKQHP